MTELWNRLKNADKPIVMYGMGNGADKILAVCENKGIEIADFFASDGFVRNHNFHGKRVMSYSETCRKYDDFIVLLSFASSLPDVVENIMRIASERELYAPDVPVSGDGVFDLEYYSAHLAEINAARELFADERSRQIFDDVIEYKLTGSLVPLMRTVSDRNELFDYSAFKNCIDCGAYNGDTARELISRCPELERVISLEPDRRTFKKLSAYAEVEPLVTPINSAAWSSNTTLLFSSQGNRNSFIGNTGVEISAVSVDSLASELSSVEYIKYDVEGAEREAIIGSRETILRYKPELLISAYHRNEDIFALPMQLHELSRDYDLYLRRGYYIPAWEIDLCAIPKKDG